MRKVRVKKQMQNFRENEMRKFCVNKYGREIIHYDTIKLLMKSSQSREFNKFFYAGKCFKQNLWFPRNLASFSQFFAYLIFANECKILRKFAEYK